MDNKVQFPKNYDRFIELGKEAAAQKNMQEAISYYEEAYAIRQEFPLNYLMVNTYIAIGENQEALTLAEEMKKQYLSCIEYMETYIQVLILNYQFLSAHGIINERILMENSGEMRALVGVKKKVRQSELLYQQFEVKRIEALKKELKGLNRCDYYQQLSIIRKSAQLPQEEFYEIAKEILVDSKIHNLVRSRVLEELSRLHYKKNVEFLWRDNQLYTVVPATLARPLETSSYQRIVLYLEKELMHNNHILYLDLLEEIRIHFALIYPFSDRLIEEPKLWAMCYIASYSDEAARKYRNELTTEEASSVQELQYKIRFELASLTI
ncbi:hypothetical protein [Candidatus Enterococcus clewellii]|uniref:TPR repeat-containing protein n=1 Tax=Candidatus Enterococcus clewellii TaxID=1834193 RepID=A0A242K2X2_9ENTE|nr:hypothetical protein [Enterococcus sp. 9E7_DIV0242]OTP12844.1 hypothetical protein A5888_003425 [Enterococcus sp. 9E7_DIV0242]